MLVLLCVGQCMVVCVVFESCELTCLGVDGVRVFVAGFYLLFVF